MKEALQHAHSVLRESMKQAHYQQEDFSVKTVKTVLMTKREQSKSKIKQQFSPKGQSNNTDRNIDWL